MELWRCEASGLTAESHPLIFLTLSIHTWSIMTALRTTQRRREQSSNTSTSATRHDDFPLEALTVRMSWPGHTDGEEFPLSQEKASATDKEEEKKPRYVQLVCDFADSLEERTGR